MQVKGRPRGVLFCKSHKKTLLIHTDPYLPEVKKIIYQKGEMAHFRRAQADLTVDYLQRLNTSDTSQKMYTRVPITRSSEGRHHNCLVTFPSMLEGISVGKWEKKTLQLRTSGSRNTAEVWNETSCSPFRDSDVW